MDTFTVEPDVFETLKRVFGKKCSKNNEKDKTTEQKDSIILPRKNFI